MENDWKKRLGIVYSTDDNYSYEHEDESGANALSPFQQTLYISLDKKNRKGKAVTMVTGFVGVEEDLKELGKLLKTKCGVGGSVKDGEIILQGEHRDKVVKILANEGYKVKKSGG